MTRNKNIKNIGIALLLSFFISSKNVLAVEQLFQGQRIPRLTTEQRDQLSSTRDNYFADGVVIFNTDIDCLQFRIGNVWANLCGEIPLPQGIARLACEGASLDPLISIRAGEPIPVGTFMKIPYSASNAGTYQPITLTSVGNPDVTATIGRGVLAPGSGVLAFSLMGTPTAGQEAPIGITFDLTPFLELNDSLHGCSTVTVGHTRAAAVLTTAVMGSLERMRDTDGNEVWALESDSPDGVFSVRVVLSGNHSSVRHGNQDFNIQLRNNRDTATSIIWNYTTFWGGGGINGSGVVSTVPSKRWGGVAGSGAPFILATSPHGENGWWGDRGIYDASGYGPEYRRYTWIELGEGNKTAYEITVMAALDTTTPTTAVSPTRVKAYIKFQQVTAI